MILFKLVLFSIKSHLSFLGYNICVCPVDRVLVQPRQAQPLKKIEPNEVDPLGYWTGLCCAKSYFIKINIMWLLCSILSLACYPDAVACFCQPLDELLVFGQWKNSWINRPNSSSPLACISYWWVLPCSWSEKIHSPSFLFCQNDELINFLIHYSCLVMRRGF